jgi:nucleoside-diphosphate-sugar epimerase
LKRRVYNINGITPSAEELARVIQARLPKVRITYHPDPLKCSIVETWPQRIDDSEARQDWNWHAAWDLERIADEVIQTLRGVAA